MFGSVQSADASDLPRQCTYPEASWRALARHWHPLDDAAGIGPKPFGAVVADQRIVVWRTKGGLSAASDLCIHRGAQLSPGSLIGDELVCPYHGFRYSASGACTLAPCTGSPATPLPARLHLRMFAAAESGHLAWVRLAEDGPAAPPVLPKPGAGDACQSLSWSASAPRAAECLIGLRPGAELRGPYSGILGDGTAFAVQPTSRARCRIWVIGSGAAALAGVLGLMRPVVESQAPEAEGDEVSGLPGDDETDRYRRWLASLGLG